MIDDLGNYLRAFPSFLFFYPFRSFTSAYRPIARNETSSFFQHVFPLAFLPASLFRFVRVSFAACVRLFYQLRAPATLFPLIFFYHIPPGCVTSADSIFPALVTMDEQPRPLAVAIGPCTLIKNNRRLLFLIVSALAPYDWLYYFCRIDGIIGTGLFRRSRDRLPGENVTSLCVAMLRTISQEDRSPRQVRCSDHA